MRLMLAITPLRRLLSVLVALLVLAQPSISASAATSTTQPKSHNPDKSAQSVSTAIIEQVLTPGEKKTLTLKVTNITDFPLPIAGTVKNFIPLEDRTGIPDTSLFDASKWFTLSEPDFILQPKQ